MRFLVLGGGGMLARSLVTEGRARGHTVLAPSHAQLDLCDTPAVADRIDGEAVDVVVNAAAFTDVDACEEREQLALEVNGRAVGRLAEICAHRSIGLVQVSSDYVFSGEASRPYREGDPTAPRSSYGRSKELGECLALEHGRPLVVRTSWLFGPGGHNFVRTITRLAEEGGELRVVRDQLGAPTYTPFLARAIHDLIEREATGIVHYCNAPPCSWYDFAVAIVECWQKSARVIPVTSDEFPRPAPRPAFSVLDVENVEGLLNRPVEGWREGLEHYREEESPVSEAPA